LPGESGCGKTIGRTILKLEEATSGRIRFTGADITHHTAGEMRKLRRHVPNAIAHVNACMFAARCRNSRQATAHSEAVLGPAPEHGLPLRHAPGTFFLG
jgi:ABC-type oligopeptide transport system ATPase subunit